MQTLRWASLILSTNEEKINSHRGYDDVSRRILSKRLSVMMEMCYSVLSNTVSTSHT